MRVTLEVEIETDTIGEPSREEVREWVLTTLSEANEMGEIKSVKILK